MSAKTGEEVLWVVRAKIPGETRRPWEYIWANTEKEARKLSNLVGKRKEAEVTRAECARKYSLGMWRHPKAVSLYDGVPLCRLCLEHAATPVERRLEELCLMIDSLKDRVDSLEGRRDDD
jgi:hypothetical protein